MSVYPTAIKTKNEISLIFDTLFYHDVKQFVLEFIVRVFFISSVSRCNRSVPDTFVIFTVK